ncbi:MAG: cyclopropane-fatty-acyl-phospholipid synthase family protein [Pseudomonadota bacterium]
MAIVAKRDESGLEAAKITKSYGFRLALAIAERLEIGSLTIEADGARYRFEGNEPGPDGHIRLHRKRALRRFATGGALGFSEAYLDGDWDSPDLPRLLEVLALNEASLAERYYGQRSFGWVPRVLHLLRPNTRRGSRRNIYAHYDLGNAFYGAWLDETMTYSSARFVEPKQSLAEAQRQKYACLADGLQLGPQDHVLEIGCGWGGFAAYAAGEIGARVTAVTISRQQHEYVAESLHKSGLNERVELQLKDYRDLEGTYSSIASIEMFEAVGERYWPMFFSQLRERLAPGGRAGLQIITIADRYFEGYRRRADFIQRHIFPGGMLPSPSVLREQIRRAGLRLQDEVTFGLDYARTLAQWGRRFQDAWPALREQGFDDRFKRLWDYYLAYCEAGFRAGYTDVGQVTLARS